MKIPYHMYLGFCNTPCYFKNSANVGSIECTYCLYFISRDLVKKTVNCKYYDDVINILNYKDGNNI